MPDEYQWMRRAVDLVRNCSSEERPDPPPKVGVVFVRDGAFLEESFRGECGAGDHAEYCVLKKLKGTDLSRVVVYTTLEPCSRRNNPKHVPCAIRLAEVGVGEVVIGMYDPNPKIYREGWKILRDANIRLRDFPGDLRDEIRRENRTFIDQYRMSAQRSGSAKIDYEQNAGEFVLGADHQMIVTRWTESGSGSIWALDYQGHVALARNAREFREIDDPLALDFSNYSVNLQNGEIAAFRNAAGDSALVKIRHVLSRRAGDDRSELSFDFEIRKRGDRGPVA